MRGRRRRRPLVTTAFWRYEACVGKRSRVSLSAPVGSTFVPVDEELQARLERSGYYQAGFAAHYDRYRPRAPSVLLELLPLLAGGGRPRLVVDLGSGTGLSTTLLEAGASEADVGLDRLRAAADGMPQPVPWWIGYRVWLGRK
jgi:hypothetical protein